MAVKPLGPMVGRREILAARPDLAAAWDGAEAAFPIRVTRSWWDRIDHADPNDPLAAQALPDARENVPDEGDYLDPVGDLVMSPMPWVVRKHADRVLLLMTRRCHVNCRYCFRRNIAHGSGGDPTPAEWDAALAYATASGAEEAILSGGDPLAVRDAHLFDTMDRLRPSIPVIRIHTRAPIAMPSRVTDALVQGLRARSPVWVLVHVNHPRELSPDVDAALARLVDAGLPLLSQTVLLAGINDDPQVLAELSAALIRRRVFPYYLHHTDAATGNAHLRVSIERGLEIHTALARLTSGIGLPTYVIDPPDGSGKRPVASVLR